MMMTFAACLWTGVFPLLQCGTYSHITRDKWIFMLILSGVTLACFIGDVVLRLLHRDPDQPRRRKISRGFLWVLGIAVLLAVRMVLSGWLSPLGWDVSWKGASTRNEGLSTQLVYVGLFLVFAVSRVRLRPVLISAAIGVLFFGTVVLLQRSGINALNLYPGKRSFFTNPEFQGTIGNVDMDVGYLSMMSGLFLTEILAVLSGSRFSAHAQPAGVSSLQSGRFFRPVLYLDLLFFSLCAAVYLIVTMDVQAGIVALGVLLGVTLFMALPKCLRLPFVICVWIAAFLVIWFWPRESGGLWEIHEMMHGRMQLSFGKNRIAVWLYSIGLAFQSPFLGGGSDTFVLRFNQYIRDRGLVIPEYQGTVQLQDYFDNPHNEYIAHLVNHGLAAMLLFIALIGAVVFVSARRKTDPLAKNAAYRRVMSPFAAAVICYAVQAFFSFSVPLVAPMFWVILGLCAGEGRDI